MGSKLILCQWQDLLVLVDDGQVPIGEYERIYPLVRAQVENSSSGIGCLVILPKEAVAPPPAVRKYLEGVLSKLPLRALAYAVEGTGFKSATVRAVLLGMGIIQRKAYPTKVVTSSEHALRWLLAGPVNQARDVHTASSAIAAARSGASA